MSDQNRPYKVGMARPAQRYIEPDEIYSDMTRGAPTSIPRQFPYTWNPVNGLGATAKDPNVFEDIFNTLVTAGGGVVSDAKGSVEDRAKEGIEDFLRAGPGVVLLEMVEQKAAEGVTKVVKEQGVNLILLAVAGGAVGGALSSKLGKTGTVLALATAGWAAMQILNAVAPKATK